MKKKIMSSCDKLQYYTYKSAMATLKGIVKREKSSMRIYKCPQCGLFHLTSIKNKVRIIKDDKYPKKYDKKDDVKMPEAQININYRPIPIIIHTGKAFTQKEDNV